ncbi:hypothetical protein BGX24_012090 [Mortierella sp. AD032]|nr:hypothetical protein BGX24_012090 [Mortierella sp. AD032]
MPTNTEPDSEETVALNSTPETPTPSQPQAIAGKETTTTAPDSNSLASNSSLPSLTEAAAITTATPSATPRLEQASVSSTPATRASSSGWDQNNDGDDEHSDGDDDDKEAGGQDDGRQDNDYQEEDNDDDMCEDDVVLSVKLTVIPDHVVEAIPDEIWCLMLSFVPPAKLITLARVCRRWKLMIERDLIASYWKLLVIQAELLDEYALADDDNDDDNGDGDNSGGRLEMPTGLIKSFPELVLGHTLVICELCLTRSKRGCGSALPLPVDRQDTLGRVWMCRPCRRKYYERHPELERAYKTEDSVSLYGLPGHPPKAIRSTGPPAPRREYFPRQYWGGGFRSSRYYDDDDSLDDYMSTDDEFGSDESGGLYFATEADLEEDDRWTREADAREAAEAVKAAKVAAEVTLRMIGATEGERSAAGQDAQGGDDNEKRPEALEAAGDGGAVYQMDEAAASVRNDDAGDSVKVKEASGSVKVDESASSEYTDIEDAVKAEGEQAGQISDTAGVTPTDDGYKADGEPVIMVITGTEGSQAVQADEASDTAMGAGPASGGEPESIGDEPDKEQEQVEESEMEEEEQPEDDDDQKMSYDESECSDDEEDESEDDGVELEAPQIAARNPTVCEARRHHGGDIGIQAHSNSNIQLQIRLKPLRNRMMETRLGVLGLVLRTDSKLCQDYLHGLMDDPFKIADVMKQMQWYFAATDYPSLVKDNDSWTAKSAAMEGWIEEAIEAHGKGVKHWFRGLEPDDDLADAVANLMDQRQPPKSLWPVLDKWIDYRLENDTSYMPPSETFGVHVGTDDLQD